MNRLIFTILLVCFSGVVHADMDLPTTIKESFPVYPKARIVQINELPGLETAILECDDSIDNVHKFYLDQVKKGGWNIEVNHETADHRTISAHKPDKGCMIDIALQNKKTMTNLTIFKK